MEITEQLIRRCLANECTPEEFEAVARWLESYPMDAARLLGWEDTDAAEPVADHDPAEVLGRLRERLFHTRGARVGHIARVRRIAGYAAAACLLAAVAGAGVWIKGRGAAGSLPQEESVLAARPGAHWFEKRNSGDRPLIIALPDSSTVKLYGHSSIRYTDSFGLVRRESWVEGEADLVVRKDQVHPFTVFSGTLATTALGTSFGVKGSRVRLYTGKVVVHNLSGGKDVYLTPGEQLSYDARRTVAAVTRFTPAAEPAPVDIKGLAFNNSPLREVFRRLSAHYHTKIAYRNAEIAGMNFTGTVSNTDSLSTILQLVGTMNGLVVKEAPTGFVVGKPME